MKGYYSIRLNKHRIQQILLDLFFLLLSIVAAYVFKFLLINQKISSIPIGKIMVYFFALAFQISILFYTLGFYDRTTVFTFSRTYTKLFVALTFVGMFNGLLFYFAKTIYIGRAVFVSQLIIFFILENVFKFFLILEYKKNGRKKDLLLVNFTRKEKKFFQDEASINNVYNLVEFRYEREEDLSIFLERLDKQTIVVISSSSKEVDKNIDMFISLKYNEFNIYDMKTFYINLTGKIPQNTFGEMWSIISQSEFLMGINSYYKIKRVIDVFLSFFMILMLIPLILVISLLILLTSKGPVFFIQERLGWNKKPFKLIKFRTMHVNAEINTGPIWASKNDPRITPIGKFLRKTRIDEVPQLFNVLKGEMSFVGNRPIRSHFAKILANEIPHYDLRFMIKPGLTGWSQVKYSYADSVESQIEKFKYELYYIKNMSFLLDMVILLKTIRTVFSMAGS